MGSPKLLNMSCFLLCFASHMFSVSECSQGGMSYVGRWNGTKRPFPRFTKPPEPDYPPDAKRIVRLRSGRKLEVPVLQLNLTRRRFVFPPPEEIPTLFELLDEIIYNALRSPEVGFADKLYKDVNFFEEILQRAKLMFIDKAEKKLEALRYSVYRLSISKGGPTFTKYIIDEAESKKRLMEAFRWNEKDLDAFRSRQEAIESLWNRVEMNMFNVHHMGRLRSNISEGGLGHLGPLPTIDPSKGHIFPEVELHDIYIP